MGESIVVTLNRGISTLVSVEDYERVIARSWNAKVKDGIWYVGGHVPGTGRNSTTGKNQSLHRFIMGVTDPNVKVDHRDGNGLNNTRSNLRVANNTQNIRNSKKHCDARGSAFKGVSFMKERGKYRAQIMCSRKKINLGSFESQEDAARCYDSNAKRLFGEFARLNFPEAL